MRVQKDRPFYMLALLVLAYMSSYVDRVVVGVLAEPIKAELKIGDTEIGLLTGLTFVIFYSVLGVPIGRLADRFNRKWLVAICLSLWSVMTTVSGLAATFTHLMLARIGVATGEAGLTPSAHSLLSDLFPKNRRSMAFSLFGAGPPLGIIVGTLGGGWLAQHFGWRTAMIGVGVPGVLLAILMVLTVREPKRGQQEDPGVREAAEREPPPPFFTALRIFASDPLFVRVTLGIACAAVGLYSMSIFIVPFLIRAYDLPIFQAAGLFGLSYGISGAVGAAFGGIATDWMGSRNRAWYMMAPMLGFFSGGVLLMTALYQPNPTVFIAMFAIGSVLVNMALAPAQAPALARVAPRLRGSASAVQLLMTGCVGLGIGPTLTGFLSDTWAKGAFAGDFGAACPGGQAVDPAFQAACAQASHVGLQHALTVTLGFYLLAAFVYFLAIKHIGPKAEPAPVAEPA